LSHVPAIPPPSPAASPRASRANDPRAHPDPTQPPEPMALTEPTVPSRPIPNPTLRLDSSLGMVVLEFHDNQGAVTGSIPSQRVLDAYRNHSAPVPQSPVLPPADPPATDTRIDPTNPPDGSH